MHAQHAVAALGLLTLAACASTPAAEAQPAPYAGVYAGSYVCQDGEHGFYLDLEKVTANADGGFAASGVLGIFPVLAGISGPSGGATGSFRVSGTINAAGEIALAPGEWLKPAGNYGAAHLEGKLRKKPDGSHALTGKPVIPGNADYCSNLIATQVQP